MSAAEFVERLRSEVAAACASVLGPEWSVAGCPYIDAWFERHAGDDAATLERMARRYTGLTAVRDASEYIAAACDRLREAVTRWQEGKDVSADVLAASEAETSEAAVQPKAGDPRLAARADPASVAARLGAGSPPDAATAARLSEAFGEAAGDVRIHDDPVAGRLADDLGAAAFTVGRHVSFATGRFQPGTPEGDALLAHEVAHVQQQRGGVARAGFPSATRAAAEADADRTALDAVARLHGDDSAALPRAAAALRTGLTLTRCSKGEEEKKKARIADLQRRKAALDAITGAPRTSSFGVLAAAMTESAEVEHKLGVETTGRGTLTGTRSGETAPAGVKRSDCTVLVLDVLEGAFKAQGKDADWQKVRKKALALAAARGGGISGIDVQRALVSELGWRGIFWAPDPSFAYPSESDKSEHAFAYRTARQSGTYYKLPVEALVVNYAPRPGSTTAKDTAQLDRLRNVPFGVLSARGAKHMALIVRGKVYEVHWTETSDKPDVIEGTALEDWAWQSGAIVVPAEDYATAFRAGP